MENAACRSYALSNPGATYKYLSYTSYVYAATVFSSDRNWMRDIVNYYVYTTGQPVVS